MPDQEQAPPPKGRRATLGIDIPIVKVIIAGSGYGEWVTHKGKDWARQDDPADEKTPTQYRRDKGGSRGGPAPVIQLAFPGPGGRNTKGSSWLGGLRDMGSNSIANLAQEVPEAVLKAALEISGPSGKGLAILIKAHSRGAVAASRVVKAVREKLPEALIEVVLYDPVPGPLHEGEDVQIDLAGAADEFTLIYSVASGYGQGFDPQYVFGAKRIIISQQGHSAGLAAGFKHEDKIYKGSNINSLPPGVYFDLNRDGENDTPLEKVGSFKEAQEKFGATLKKSAARKSDPLREGIVLEVLSEYFAGTGTQAK
jgi:hypothetical protein